MKRGVSLLVLACGLLGARPALAEGVTLAAASDLRLAMDELTARFAAAGGPRFEVVYGSSGKFYAQIVSGAPFDAFFSANTDYPRQLEQQGLTVPGTRFAYGIGRLVLWTPASSSVAVETGWKCLSGTGMVAIANPEHAPYGQAAVAALTRAGLYPAIKPRLVLGENISQAAQFVVSGAAPVGLIALSLTKSESMRQGRFWLVPQDQHPPIVQEAVALSRSPHLEQLKRFFAFVRGPEGRSVLERYGFGVPRP